MFQAPADFLDKPLTDLVSYLIKPAKQDIARVRAVFRWIAAQNLDQLESGGAAGASYPPMTPRDYLLGMRNEVVSYHKLMQDMCRCAKLCRHVGGIFRVNRKVR